MALSQEDLQASSGSGGAWRVRLLPYPRKTVSVPRWKWERRTDSPAWLRWLPSPRITWEKREVKNSPVDPAALTENLELLLNTLREEGYRIHEILILGQNREEMRRMPGPQWHMARLPGGLEGILVVGQKADDPLPPVRTP